MLIDGRPQFTKISIFMNQQKLQVAKISRGKLVVLQYSSLIFVFGKKGSKAKKRMKEEKIEKGDCGPPTPKVFFFEILSFDSCLQGDSVPLGSSPKNLKKKNSFPLARIKQSTANVSPTYLNSIQRQPLFFLDGWFTTSETDWLAFARKVRGQCVFAFLQSWLEEY